MSSLQFTDGIIIRHRLQEMPFGKRQHFISLLTVSSLTFGRILLIGMRAMAAMATASTARALKL